MKVIVVGLGVQGYKRRKIAGNDFVYSVDPINSEADFKNIQEVPLDKFDAALLCIPDDPKIELAKYCLSNGKHILIEKPLWANKPNELEELEALAKKNKVVCYTAYNHRFEPHFMKMKEVIDSGVLGKIYSCRMFYGNGTAKLVKDSLWRDSGAGVIPDLGSHLIDTCRFWFGSALGDFSLIKASNFENQAPDHAIIMSQNGKVLINLEMTLCMWKNHFTCDILAEKGSAHIESLCKWGPTKFTIRKRMLPSGKPPEESVVLVQDDPTWDSEYQYFLNLIKENNPTDLSKDIYLNITLKKLGAEAIK